MATSDRPIATLSLDLDNLWSYLATHGDAGWERFPSFHTTLVPRVIDIMRRRNLPLTVFIVGKDATLPQCRKPLNDLVQAGFELGSHSFLHEQWLAMEGEDAVNQDLARTEESIERCTGVLPRGFRGPGFSLSTGSLNVLLRRGYHYDASSFPTYMGPLSRAIFMTTSKLTGEARRKRARLFGRLADAIRPLEPHLWQLEKGQLVEVPVTTVPGVKLPLHMTYILFLAQYSEALALTYFRSAMAMCRRLKISPSMLLHPPEFVSLDSAPGMDFFPNMRMPSEKKLRFVDRVLAEYAEQFDVMPIGRAVEVFKQRKLKLIAAERYVPAPDPVEMAIQTSIDIG
jgi:peptidoglycan-N-acetylglucosamine deacetylase